MPQPRVIDTTPNDPEPSGIQQFFSKLGKDYKDKKDKVEIDKLISSYQQNREDGNAWEDLQLGLEKSNISPTKRLETQASLNNMKKTIIERDKALNSRMGKTIKSAKERESEYQNLLDDGYPPEEAQIYVDSPPGVKQSLERNHRMEKARGIRGSPPQKESPALQDQEQAPSEPSVAGEEKVLPGQENAPIVPGIEEAVGKEDQWPDIAPPEKMIPAERIKWENNNEKENIKSLKEVETKKKAYRDTGLLIRSMTKGNESKKLPSGLGKMVTIDPDTGDIRPTAQLAGQMNPETELYVKNLKQFLKGAKEFFGARVTNFDVSTFMQQLPSLLNSEQGRRVILKQMELVNQLESVHANELDKGIKHYGRKANYIDISRTVDERVAEKEGKLLGKIDNVVEASQFLDKMAKNPKLFKDTVLMEKDGQFRAVKPEDVEKARAKEWSEY